jgi:exonuclease III
MSMIYIYLPSPPPDFLTKIFLDFSELNSDTAVVGGDFNCLLNPLIDKFPSGIASPSPQARSLKAICDDLGYAVIWRTFHPSNREFTFFSAPHGCQTRIDYVFMPRM